jgi:hypothetical protein
MNDSKCPRCLALQAEVARLREELRRERDAHYATIGERDGAQEAADALAYAIAPIEVIGEHSNMNDPWANALEALDAERAQHAMALGRMQVSFSAEEQRALKAEAEVARLTQSLVAARDVLAAFAKQAGVVQGGYSATVTEVEAQVLRAVADIDQLLVARLTQEQEKK